MSIRRIATALALIGTLLGPALVHAQRQTHTVAAGEFLGSLSHRYGVSVEDIMRWNELESDRIRPGQELVVAPEPAPESVEERAAWEMTYVVLRGDNATRIAERVGVSVEELRRANPGARLDRVRPGQRLSIVGAARALDHTVRRGETLARLAARFELRHLDLLAWNPTLNRRGLEVGMTLRMYTDVRVSRSESVGAPNAGTLVNGEPLVAHRAYIIRDTARAVGTHETVQWLVEAFDVALDADPHMPRVRVHDITVEGGGQVRGHRSHQSGRDVDIAYYRRQCRNDEPCFMSRSGPEDLDVAHQWRVFRYWLEHRVVTAIFMDHALQAPLYEYARTHGATRDELGAWFQYPRPATQRVGVIRHYPGHDDHFHVRFICPPNDDQCSEAAPHQSSDTAVAHQTSPPRAPAQPQQAEVVPESTANVREAEPAPAVSSPTLSVAQDDVE